MRLWVAWPDGSGEFERPETHDVVDEAAADALLAAMPRGWHEATLREADKTHDDGARPTRLRLPRSGWVDVRWWPDDPSAVPPFSDDGGEGQGAGDPAHHPRQVEQLSGDLGVVEPARSSRGHTRTLPG